MTYFTVALFNSDEPASGTPLWWKHFLRGNPPGERFNAETTNSRLMEYAASYVVIVNSRKINRYVDFYDERAYTWFLLKWS